MHCIFLTTTIPQIRTPQLRRPESARSFRRRESFYTVNLDRGFEGRSPYPASWTGSRVVVNETDSAYHEATQPVEEGNDSVAEELVPPGPPVQVEEASAPVPAGDEAPSPAARPSIPASSESPVPDDSSQRPTPEPPVPKEGERHEDLR